MEFNKKLQKLRKNFGLTQEELAEALYVSRAAVSKWESGRGYPNIDSLKEISTFFSVSIDNLLSGEELLSIAEKENKINIRKIYDIFFGTVDLLSLLLIILPLYPDTVNGYIYSVNLLAYTETSSLNIIVYWLMFLFVAVSGIIKLILTQKGEKKWNEILMKVSMLLAILTVIYLAMAREAYAIVVAFILLIIKGAILLKIARTEI